MQPSQKLLSRVVQEAFAAKAGMHPLSVQPGGHRDDLPSGCTIRFSGPLEGFITLQISPPLLQEIASVLLPGQVVSEAQLEWACREMLRIISADFLTSVSGNSAVYDFSYPQRPHTPTGRRPLFAMAEFASGHASIRCDTALPRCAPGTT